MTALHELKREGETDPLQTAVIQEALRLSFGVSTRLQRLCPDEELVYDDGKTQWRIPINVSSLSTSEREGN